ncbi:hypothetical protein [Catellatospora sichuanensis]|uniref:hypothetical protein n=1 Tax=Catellatospora sichuanensis TaxID=1969805 RepID=UPI001182ADEA|nr:hypothetical protein [Catellatospora sichuanensis]
MRTDMLIRRGLLFAATALTAAALAATAGVPAQAAVPVAGVAVQAADQAANLANAKKLATVRIDGRLAMLRAEGVAIRNAARLTDAHQAALQKTVDAGIAGLTELRAKVAAETTLEAVRAGTRSMVEDYRVYLLVRPQVHLTLAADVAAAALTRLRTLHDKLAQAVTAAKSAGKDLGDAEAKLAHLKSELDAMESALSGLADDLLAVQPGPDSAAIRAKTAAARADVRTARTHLRAAATDAKALRDLLKP